VSVAVKASSAVTVRELLLNEPTGEGATTEKCVAGPASAGLKTLHSITAIAI
jgi:hypothetical protein